MASVKYILGIDLGTTSVKVALLDLNTKEIIATKSRDTRATVPSELNGNGNEQDGSRILTALQFCVSGLSKDSLTKVAQIGISGQMHGVILWKKGEGWTRNNFGRFEVGSASPLFTWQDGRCTPEFLSGLPQPQSHLKIASGLGCATLFWLQRNKPDMLNKFDCAGTIQDYVVCMLCGCDPIMSIHNAASWGYFDCASNTWNKENLSSAGFPVHLLPDVAAPGSTVAGTMQETWYEMPQGTPVGVALGDMQCSFLSRLPAADDAVLNMSTSAQLAFQMHEEFDPPTLDTTSSIEYFPYFKGRYLAVAASLTGGNVMAEFVKMLQIWTHELGLGVPKAKIWEKLSLLGQDSTSTDLHISPTIFGERHSPAQRASVTHITPQNLKLGSVYVALCTGVIANLHDMMSQDFLMAAGVKRIVCSGKAVTKNSIVRREIESQYKLPLVLSEGCDADAAVGAALAMLL